MTLLPGKTLFLHLTGSQCFLWLFSACGRHLRFWKQRKSEESRKCDCCWIRWVWGERICTTGNCTYKGDVPLITNIINMLPWPLFSRFWLVILGSPVTFRGLPTFLMVKGNFCCRTCKKAEKALTRISWPWNPSKCNLPRFIFGGT